MHDEKLRGPAADANQTADPTLETIADSHTVYHGDQPDYDFCIELLHLVCCFHEQGREDELPAVTAAAGDQCDPEASEWLAGFVRHVNDCVAAHGVAETRRQATIILETAKRCAEHQAEHTPEALTLDGRNPEAIERAFIRRMQECFPLDTSSFHVFLFDVFAAWRGLPGLVPLLDMEADLIRECVPFVGRCIVNGKVPLTPDQAAAMAAVREKWHELLAELEGEDPEASPAAIRVVMGGRCFEAA